jgi:hypothetical protein
VVAGIVDAGLGWVIIAYYNFDTFDQVLLMIIFVCLILWLSCNLPK